MSSKILQYELHTDVHKHILEYRFTHFAPYVVHIEITKKVHKHILEYKFTHFALYVVHIEITKQIYIWKRRVYMSMTNGSRLSPREGSYIADVAWPPHET